MIIYISKNLVLPVKLERKEENISKPAGSYKGQIEMLL